MQKAQYAPYVPGKNDNYYNEYKQSSSFANHFRAAQKQTPAKLLLKIIQCNTKQVLLEGGKIESSQASPCSAYIPMGAEQMGAICICRRTEEKRVFIEAAVSFSFIDEQLAGQSGNS